MCNKLPLGGFDQEWISYLERHGHCVESPTQSPGIICSRNGKGRAYRWVLMRAWNDSLLLTAGDRRELALHKRQAVDAGQECFLVVKFDEPEEREERVVILPAALAVRRKRITGDKGGIPWNG